MTTYQQVLTATWDCLCEARPVMLLCTCEPPYKQENACMSCAQYVGFGYPHDPQVRDEPTS